jgi:hypothetical protein
MRRTRAVAQRTDVETRSAARDTASGVECVRNVRVVRAMTERLRRSGFRVVGAKDDVARTLARWRWQSHRGRPGLP